jgi:hypothetical protein
VDILSSVYRPQQMAFQVGGCLTAFICQMTSPDDDIK